MNIDFEGIFVKHWFEWILGLATTGLMVACGKLRQSLKKERKKNAAIENGLKGILRLQIIDTYDKCVSDGRKITLSRKDAIGEVYRSYVELCESAEAVDDTVKQLYDEIVHMPLARKES